MTETLQAVDPPQTNGIDLLDDDERAKIRPADIDADVKEMERRKRVENIMNSKMFREELERIIETQMNEGTGTNSLMQQISDMMGVNKQAGNFYKNSSCVLPINDIRGIEAMSYGKGEKILRCKLAAVYRLIDLCGWNQGTTSLITARLNQDEEHFLVNPYGMLYHEITASSLIKIDMQANIVEQGTTNFSVNISAFSLHGAIHAARPDIKCIIHLHTPSVVAISATKAGILPISQESVVIGEVSTHPFLGGQMDPEEKDKLARNLGPNNKILLLTNQGVLCCGETIEEAFFNARNTVLACEAQLKLLPLGIDNIILLNEETKKRIYEAAHKAPESTPRPDKPSILEGKVERKWRVGGIEFEGLMRMLDNVGFRTGYIYRHPLVKGDVPRPKNDVEVPPAVSSLGYLLEEEELYKKGLWRNLGEGKKGQNRSRWLNSPNVYQRVEFLETGTQDPKKITKWVADGSPTHSSTPVKIDNALQFVPKNTNPKEFKLKQQQIKDYRRADKISAGPQSYLLDTLTWEEAKKMQDATINQSGDQVVLMGAASKGIIQRGHQHNAMVYKSPYAKNPFDSVTDEELDEYKKVVEKKVKGDYDTDFSESDISSAAINKRMDSLHLRSPTSETEEESRDEPQVLRIETKQAPRPSQPEVVLSDGYRMLTSQDICKSTYRTTSHFGLPKGSYLVPNPVHFHIVHTKRISEFKKPRLTRLTPYNCSSGYLFNHNRCRMNSEPLVTVKFDNTHSVSVNIPIEILRGFIMPFASALSVTAAPMLNTRSSQTTYMNNFQHERPSSSELRNNYTPLTLNLESESYDIIDVGSTSSFEAQILQKMQDKIMNLNTTVDSDTTVVDSSTSSDNLKHLEEIDEIRSNDSLGVAVDVSSNESFRDANDASFVEDQGEIASKVNKIYTPVADSSNLSEMSENIEDIGEKDIIKKEESLEYAEFNECQDKIISKGSEIGSNESFDDAVFNEGQCEVENKSSKVFTMVVSPCYSFGTSDNFKEIDEIHSSGVKSTKDEGITPSDNNIILSTLIDNCNSSDIFKKVDVNYKVEDNKVKITIDQHRAVSKNSEIVTTVVDALNLCAVTDNLTQFDENEDFAEVCEVKYQDKSTSDIESNILTIPADTDKSSPPSGNLKQFDENDEIKSNEGFAEAWNVKYQDKSTSDESKILTIPADTSDSSPPCGSLKKVDENDEIKSNECFAEACDVEILNDHDKSTNEDNKLLTISVDTSTSSPSSDFLQQSYENDEIKSRECFAKSGNDQIKSTSEESKLLTAPSDASNSPRTPHNFEQLNDIKSFGDGGPISMKEMLQFEPTDVNQDSLGNYSKHFNLKLIKYYKNEGIVIRNQMEENEELTKSLMNNLPFCNIDDDTLIWLCERSSYYDGTYGSHYLDNNKYYNVKDVNFDNDNRIESLMDEVLQDIEGSINSLPETSRSEESEDVAVGGSKLPRISEETNEDAENDFMESTYNISCSSDIRNDTFIIDEIEGNNESNNTFTVYETSDNEKVSELSKQDLIEVNAGSSETPKISKVTHEVNNSEDEGIGDIALDQTEKSPSKQILLDDRIKTLADAIYDYLQDQCFEIRELVLFPEILHDRNLNKLLAKLKNMYDEFYSDKLSDEDKNELRMSISAAILSILESDSKLNADSSNDSSLLNIVSDKIFSITEFVSDILDSFFNLVSDATCLVVKEDSNGENFLEFTKPFRDDNGNLLHSTPESVEVIEANNSVGNVAAKSPKETIVAAKPTADTIVTAFKKDKSHKSGAETFWISCSSSPQLRNKDIPKTPGRRVFNIDDIPLRPPEDLVIKSPPEEPRCNLFGPSYEEECELIGPRAEKKHETIDVKLDDILAGGDGSYVSLDEPEMNVVLHNEVKFYRICTVNSSSFVKTNSVTLQKNKNNSESDGNESFHSACGNLKETDDDGDWMGYDMAKF